jgi:long-chain acyl-CoA synthetase
VIDEYYAASEGGGTYVFAQEWLEHPGTVGRAWPNAEIVILDDDDNELPPGQIGTVYMHMQTGQFEYFKDKEKTDRSFRGKFFTVGDAGYLDEDGWLFLSDRKIDMIISGGANIYPAEIEAALDEHPRVRTCAVIGLPDDDLGNVVYAIVQTDDGTPIDLDDLRAHLGERLVRYKVPREFEFTDEPLRDDAGKSRRSALRAERLKPPKG